jgi:hypothetical protein
VTKPDFRAFLKPADPIVLPYFGGTRVDAKDRRYRVEGEHELGWWRFAIEGRRAVPTDRAEQIDLGALPAMRGHWIDGYIVASGRELARVALPPSEEPQALGRVVGRRWYSGEVLLDSIEFEDDAEMSARAALEEGRSIADVRGIVPSLRAAFAYALGLAVARERRVQVTVRELSPAVVAIADGGRAAANARIDQLVEQRAAYEREQLERRRREAEARELQMQEAERERRREEMGHVARAARPRNRGGSPQQRADAALEAAGARMLSARRTGDELEVTFMYMDTRIIATVDPDTLHVWDSGICLAGADEELTLDSLPSVIKEAIETDRLNITRF